MIKLNRPIHRVDGEKKDVRVTVYRQWFDTPQRPYCWPQILNGLPVYAIVKKKLCPPYR